jgi:hypothetical protein
MAIVRDQWGIDSAWEDVESLLPEGWSLLFWRTFTEDGTLGYGVEAALPSYDEDRARVVIFRFGATPAAALRELAAKLREVPR